MPKTCRSKNEIKVFAQRRSGHHAVTNWILKHFSGPTLFINDFTNQKEKTYKNDILMYNMNERQIRLEKTAANPISKQCLIYNIEEEFLSGINKKLESRKHFYPINSGQKIIEVIVIRDPYNMFASRIKTVNRYWPESKFGKKENSRRLSAWAGKKSIKLWKEYAEEYLGKTNFLKNNKVVVNYNMWFSNLSYRKEISRNLGLKFTDNGLSFVPNYGHGSSFDLRKFNGSGQSMEVLSRWKFYHNKSKEYNEIFKDRELVHLSEEIFGDPPF